MRIPDSFHLAEEKGIEFSFEEANLKEAHPNSAELELEGISGRSLTVVGESLGGSRINIAKVDGIEANFSGSYPTLVVHNDDQPGHVADVTAMLAHKSINIATMQPSGGYPKGNIFKSSIGKVHIRKGMERENGNVISFSE